MSAKKPRQSMNSATVQALKKGLGLESPARRKRDLASIAGAWSQKDAEAFERATAGSRAIDPELWRK